MAYRATNAICAFARFSAICLIRSCAPQSQTKMFFERARFSSNIKKKEEVEDEEEGEGDAGDAIAVGFGSFALHSCCCCWCRSWLLLLRKKKLLGHSRGAGPMKMGKQEKKESSTEHWIEINTNVSGKKFLREDMRVLCIVHCTRIKNWIESVLYYINPLQESFPVSWEVKSIATEFNVHMYVCNLKKSLMTTLSCNRF